MVVFRLLYQVPLQKGCGPTWAAPKPLGEVTDNVSIGSFPFLYSLIQVQAKETVHETGELAYRLLDLVVESRDRARQKRDFELADFIRDRLHELNISLEDARGKTNWQKMEN